VDSIEAQSSLRCIKLKVELRELTLPQLIQPLSKVLELLVHLGQGTMTSGVRSRGQGTMTRSVRSRVV
jgi:hypothetical protein